MLMPKVVIYYLLFEQMNQATLIRQNLNIGLLSCFYISTKGNTLLYNCSTNSIFC